MQPLCIYLETSVFGFLFDRTERNAWRREVTETLFQQIEEGKIKAFVSDIVLAELNATPNPEIRKSLLEIASNFPFTESVDMVEIEKAAMCLLSNKVVPLKFRDDAFHAAFMFICRQLDVLVTWNCRHLANENVKRLLKSVAMREGYRGDFEMLTPPEVLIYD